jgi:hypothetical protein
MRPHVLGVMQLPLPSRIYSTNLLKAKLWRNIGLKFRLTSLTAVMDANEHLTVKIYLLPQYTR